MALLLLLTAQPAPEAALAGLKRAPVPERAARRAAAAPQQRRHLLRDARRGTRLRRAAGEAKLGGAGPRCGRQRQPRQRAGQRYATLRRYRAASVAPATPRDAVSSGSGVECRSCHRRRLGISGGGSGA
eukprot:360494-Chlamydomonas_euryale.AAC.1